MLRNIAHALMLWLIAALHSVAPRPRALAWEAPAGFRPSRIIPALRSRSGDLLEPSKMACPRVLQGARGRTRFDPCTFEIDFL